LLDAKNDVEYLQRLLGSPFVDWVLAEPAGTLTPAQRKVASDLAQLLRQSISLQPELPIEHVIPRLASYQKSYGMTLINHARQRAGGNTQSPEEVPDRLLNAFRAFAVECYGEMLLPGGPFRGSGLDFHNYCHTRSGKNLVHAFIAERMLPKVPEVDYSKMDADTAYLYRSLNPGMFASGLVRCAWNLAKIDHGTPSLAEFIEQLAVAVDQFRTYLEGEPTTVTAIASLTGVRLPPGTEISGQWGRIRSARPEDHPPALRDLASQRTGTTTESGDRIEISGAGDVIIEARVRVKFELRVDGNGWSEHPLDDFGDTIDRISLAFALAVTRPARPVIYCMWARTLYPTGGTDPWPLADPNFMAMRVPALLTAEEINSWERWINVITSADMTYLKRAVTYTLRAMTERRDAYDRLIDAVIAWESLFGGHPDTTLRISASLARLLHSSAEERQAAQVEYKKIYGARSDIVHSNHNSLKKLAIQQVDQYCKSAIDVSLKAIERILTTHKDLLTLDSATRSLRVLLGADEGPATPTGS
jgi:Apea-like HEPN